MNETYFTGTIARIIFENPSNFFKILLIEIEETDSDFDEEEIIVTGTMAEVIEGEEYQFFGSLVTHPKYGQQLQLSRYERAKPTASGLIKYFSSDQFKGIGKKTAEKIVQLYDQDNTIDAILAEPEKLTQISGLTSSHRQAFIEKLQANYGTERILAKLAEYGIPNKLAFQIQDTYKEKTLTIIEDNPYQLVEDIQGLGFKIADHIAQNLGIASDAPQRLRAAIMHCLLQEAMETGNTYVEAKQLLENALLLLENARQVQIQEVDLATEMGQLLAEGKIQNEGTKLFDNSLYFAEAGIHKHLQRILDHPAEEDFDTDSILTAIEEVEESLDISYDNIQRAAIVAAIQQPLFILTGGPGTGKTTVIKGIIAVYAQLHQLDLKKLGQDSPVLLAAPTGRAARRMNELTGLPAATIHRHLGIIEGGEEATRDDYLEAELIIIDEFSMVDTWLANQLFSHIASHTKVLIVGDADQLPSVSPGQVLTDLLKIPDLPHITLEKIFRQSSDSTIVTLASQIRQGQLPEDLTLKKADRSYFEARNEHIPEMIKKITSAAIKSGIPAQDVQILAPMYRGQAGIDHLNQVMQDLLNPLADHDLEFANNQQRFRQGDKIIHLVNDAESNVFNGDLGVITDLLPGKYTDSKQDELTLNFDGIELIYPRNEWYKITLAYAMSIHKSQGSEFQVVILPMTSTSYRMLERNLLYTAITRAKSKLILLGEHSAFARAIHHAGAQRKTYLIERFLAEGTNISTDLNKAAQLDPITQQETSAPNQTQVNQEDNQTGLATATAPTPIKIEQPAPAPVTSGQLSLDLNEVSPETMTGPYILTEANWALIDPMIGLSQADIQAFFKK